MLEKFGMGTLIALAVLLAVFIALLYFQAFKSRTMNVVSGHDNGLLKFCPTSPNCVSSQVEPEDKHFIKPIADPSGDKWGQLTNFLDSHEKTERQLVEDNYIHYTFRTPLMGFVDDVEFYHDSENGLIHVRSASRVGYSDGGTNKKRVEMIRSKL